MTFLFGFLRSIFRTRQALLLENLALRQQLAAYHRTRKRRALRAADRVFWVWLSRLWPAWSSALVIVKPQTVLRCGSGGRRGC